MVDDLFIQRYLDLQDRLVPKLIDDLSDEELRSISAPGFNSIAWILWHLARGEDLALNGMVLEQPTIWQSQNYGKRLGYATNSAGTGMTTEQVVEFSEAVNLNELKNYRQDVVHSTKIFLAAPQTDLLQEQAARPLLEQVFLLPGVFPEGTPFLQFYEGKTKEWFLNHLAFSHYHYHLGQVTLIKKLISS